MDRDVFIALCVASYELGFSDAIYMTAKKAEETKAKAVAEAKGRMGALYDKYRKEHEAELVRPN